MLLRPRTLACITPPPALCTSMLTGPPSISAMTPLAFIPDSVNDSKPRVLRNSGTPLPRLISLSCTRTLPNTCSRSRLRPLCSTSAALASAFAAASPAPDTLTPVTPGAGNGTRKDKSRRALPLALIPSVKPSM